MGDGLKFPFRMFLKMSSAIWERFAGLVVGCWLLVVGMSLTGNFVSMIFFRTCVFRVFGFFRVIGLESMLCFLIVRKTFRSM